MTAVIKIWELTASDAGSDKTASTVRFKLADDQALDANNPLTIPSGVTPTRSFWKQLRMYCATAPDTQIDNLEFYSDGANGFGTGVTVNASNRGPVAGTDIDTNSTADLPDGTDLFGLTSGAALNIDAYHTAAITATGVCGDFVRSLTTLRNVVKYGVNCWKLLKRTISSQVQKVTSEKVQRLALDSLFRESNRAMSALHLSEMKI